MNTSVSKKYFISYRDELQDMIPKEGYMKKFRKIPSLKFLYEIDQDGNLRNTKSKHFIAKSYDKYGYVVYHINNSAYKDKQCFKKAHILVMEVWGPTKPEWATMIDHIDRDRTNNNISNLRWANAEINSQNRDQTYLTKIKGKRCVGTNINTNETYEFESTCQAADFILTLYPEKNKHTVSNCIIDCCNKKQKVGYKFTWKYI